MASNQEVQDVLNTLTSTINAGKSIEESFTAAIAQHSAQAAQLTQASSETNAATAGPPSVPTSHFENQQHGHEQLQRIAEHHQQQLQQGQHQQIEQDPDTIQIQSGSSSSASHASSPHDVLQRIATMTGETASTLAAVASSAETALSTVAATSPVVAVLEAVSAPAVSATVAVASAPAPVPALAAKPVQGSEEWRKIRRDNHKEVERRRRENINDGITQLAELVPNSEKNKGAILKQAVKYIESIEEANKKLMADIEAGSSTKLDLDKALVEKSILKTSLESLKVEHEQLKRDLDALKGQLNEESDEHTSKRQRTE